MYYKQIITAAALASSAQAATHKIGVSNAAGDLVFSPSNVKAAKGDTVVFSFWPSKHSVAQGSFDTPCAPLDGGFYSGFVPVTSGVSSTTFEITVNSTDPIWFYCTATGHCQNGMVGAINAASSGQKTLAAYQKASETTSDTTSPPSVAGGTLNTGSSASGSATASGSSTASGSAASASGTGAASSLNRDQAMGLTAVFGVLGSFAAWIL